MSSSDILSDLNEAQRKAVVYDGGPLLVVAGAGSGKTRILTSRIIHMIHQGISPSEILGVTFTNKAAQEMNNRVKRHVSSHVAIGTFHSICLKILKEKFSYAGLQENFSIYDDQDQISIIKDCMKDLEIDVKEINPKHVRERISRCKDQLIFATNIDQDKPDYEDSLFIPIYEKYQQKLQQCHGVDFGDLIALVVKMFEEHPDILETYQDRFRYILLDEYQDTNYAQYVFINQLAKKYQQITVVGDPDQSIYAWRGANIENILKFEKDFPRAKVVRLEQNYRSTNNILNAANALISYNVERKPKNLWSENGEGELIEVYQASTERVEAYYLVNKILALQNNDFAMKDMVAFYRTHSQSRVLEEELMRNNIPYRIVGGLKFYARKEIKDLLAYLKIIQNSNDEVSLLRIINTPKRSIGKTAVDKIQELCRSKAVSFYDGMKLFCDASLGSPKLRKEIIHFVSFVEKLKDAQSTSTLLSLLERVMDESGYVKMLEDEDTLESKIRLENIREFYTSIKEFEESMPSDAQNNPLQTYLEYVALQSDIDQWYPQDQVFTLMTLHSAKGLEFPVVFLLGMEEGLLPHMNSMAGSLRELEEERRLCYVGFTRAMKKLFLTYAISRKQFGYSKRQAPSRFLHEIPKDLIKGAPPFTRTLSDYFASGYEKDDDDFGENIEEEIFS